MVVSPASARYVSRRRPVAPSTISCARGGGPRQGSARRDRGCAVADQVHADSAAGRQRARLAGHRRAVSSASGSSTSISSHSGISVKASSAIDARRSAASRQARCRMSAGQLPCASVDRHHDGHGIRRPRRDAVVASSAAGGPGMRGDTDVMHEAWQRSPSRGHHDPGAATRLHHAGITTSSPAAVLPAQPVADAGQRLDRRARHAVLPPACRAAGPCACAAAASPARSRAPRRLRSSILWVSGRPSASASSFSRSNSVGVRCTSPPAAVTIRWGRSIASCAHLDHLLAGDARLGAAQQRAHAGQQLADPERLGQVVVGAGVERADLVLLLADRRDQQDRRAQPVAQLPADVGAVGVGQHQVEDHQVGRRAAPPGSASRRRPFAVSTA